MEHKNPMSRVERLHREKVTRYSIRKYSFGAASVAVAALFMFLGNGAVSANELSKQDTPSVEAPAQATEEKPNSEEATAKPVEATTPTLDKSELTNLISEIETKLSNGSYDNKTEESVAVLKADLEAAKAELANATTQAELKKAYSKLVTTVNTKLKAKPVEKKETPAVDTTNGQPTVGKKAENTEKKSESNSIENTGSKDERNGQALDRNNAFRAETTATQGTFTYSMEYSNGKEIYLYNEEDADINITVNSTAGNIKRATVKAGSGQFVLKSKSDQAIAYAKGQGGVKPEEEEVEIDGYGWSYHQTLSDTPGPVKIKITGKPNDTFKAIKTYTKTEDQRAVLGARYLELEDSNGNKLAGGSNLSAPGAFNLVVKSQTYKYDIQQPESNDDKIAVSNVDSLTEADITKIKNELKIKYSDKATTEDARLASKRGEVVNPRSSVVKEIAVANGTVTVTYNDDSVDTAPVSSVARVNAAPTVEIPFSVEGKKDIYVYANEDIDVDLKYNDDSGKIKFATIKQGGNKALSPVDSAEPNIINNEYNTQFTQINAETATPAIVKITGKMTKETPGLTASKFPTDENGEYRIVTRYATATDLDDAIIENTAVGNSYATDPGAFTLVLKAQTRKYDIKAPETKVTVANANNITEDEFNQIKDSIKIQYSTTNPDKNLLDKQGKDVENQTDRIESITREGNNVVVTYKDGSKDTKALADFVNVAPKVALPYSNEANKQIYVYTGENTDLTFKGSDENEVKDLYLRGPGDLSGNNAAGYGLPTGKVENGAVTGEGSVSADKRTATIKMTGKTSLPAGQQWTSFIVSKDNDGKLSNTDYRALDKDPNARQKPGYAHFLVKNQTSKYDIATPTEKVAVTDPANVTQDELDKIKEKLQIEYSTSNDDANLAEKKGKAVDAEDAKTKIKSVEKDADGKLVVTYTDGSTDKKPLSDFVTLDKQPAIEAVEKAAEAQIAAINKTPNATDDEKQAAIDKVNADKKKALDEIAKPEVTTKDALDKAKTAGTDAIAADNPVVAKKDAAKADVETARKAKEDAIKANPNLTQAEKDAAIAKNNTAAAEATKAIDSATTNDAVDQAKTAGTGEIAKVNPVAKEAAKKAIADELAKKEEAIDGRTDLTDAEKAKAKEDAQAKAKAATDAINAQPDNAETPEKATEAQTAVDGAKDKGVADVKAVNPVAKEAAKKAIADELAEKEKAIDGRTDLTDAEKAAAKDDAKAKAKAATDAINAQPDNATTPEEAAAAQTAVNDAKDKGVADVKAVNPVAKEAAKKAIADELAEKEKAIDGRTDLTDEEKAAAKKDAQDKAKEATDAIDAQPSNAATPEAAEKAQTAVNGAKDKGVADVKAVDPAAAKKPAAKKAVEDALKAKVDAIDARTDLTDDEKKAAKDKAAAEAKKATDAIDAATTDAAVDTAKEAGTGEIAKVNPVAKEAAKKAVADELAEKEKAIDARTDLTDAEKAAAKEDAKAKAKAATDAINAQPDNAATPEAAAEAQTAVNDAKDKGVADVKAVNPVAKEAAKKAIADELAEKEKAIDGRTDLTDEEKAAAKKDAQDKAKEATDAIDAQPSNAATPEAAEKAQTAVNGAKDKGVADVKAVDPAAAKKPAAKKAIDDALKAKEDAIDARTDLTDDEKKAAKDLAKDAADKAKAAIDAATTDAAVDTAKDAGTGAVEAINPEAKAKPEAKKAIDDALKAKEDAIDARTDLTDDEKKAAKEAAKEAADKAKAAIDAAPSNAEVDKAKEAGTGEIAKVNPVAKEAAKKAVADELAKKEAEIAGRNDLTDEEKAKAKEEAQAKAKEATDAIDAQPSNAETPEKAAEAQTAVDGAKDKGVADVTAVNPAATKKPEAKKAIDDALKAKEAAIDARTDLTDDEKKAAKDAAKDAADKAKEAIDAAPSDAEVDKAKEAGTGAVEAINPEAKAKPEAKQAIDDALKAKEAAIDARTDLTDDEKKAAKDAAKDAADKAKAAIDAATTDAAVDTAKDAGTGAVEAINPEAKAKPEAKKAIDDALKAKEDAIDARTDLTDDEKKAAKEAAKEAADKAKAAIDAAPSNAEVDKAKEAGTGEIAKVNPVAKEAAKKAVADELAKKEAEIAGRNDLTDEEKAKAKEEAQAKAKEATDAIDAQPSNAETPEKAAEAQTAVDGAKDKGVADVTAVNPAATKKPEAKKAIDDALKAKEAAIDARTDLTDDEKKAAKDAAKDAADKAKEAIDAAPSDAEVDKAKEAGTGAVEAINPEAKAKPEAKQAIDDALKAKEAAIDARTDLTDDEKKAAKDAAKDAADKAKAAIDAATTDAAVDTAKDAGTGAVEAINPEAKAKPEAKKAIDDALKAKEDAIDARTDLTDDEKKAAKEAAKEAADKAKAAIDAAPSNAEVDKAKEAGTGEIAKVNPVAKEAAKKAVADELAKKEAEIAGRNDLTDEEKAKAKEEAQAKAKEATDAIDAQPSNAETPEKAAEAQTAVDGAKDKGVADVTAVNPAATKKPEAKKAIDDALKAKEAAIDARTDLTDDEKKAAKDAAKDAADKAKEAIDAAPSNAEVDKAKEAGTGAVEAINPEAKAKPEAKQAIDDALKAKEAAIDARTDLTDDEKKAAKDAAKDAADKAKEAIDAATDDAALNKAKEAGTGEIAKVNPVAKEAAKKAVADELAKKEAEIAGRNDLTDEEKAKAKEEAQAKAKEATDAIDAQPSNAETPEKAAEAQTAVDGAKDKGVADVKAVDPEAKAKPVAKKAIEDKLAKQLEDIANTPDATDDEKKVAADAAKALAEGAKKEIDKAGTDAEVKQLQEEAEGEIEKSVPVVEDKPNARKAIEDEAKAKKEAIDARTDLTPKAKEDLKAQVDAIADQAKKSVDAAKTSEAVDGIEESDKAAIKAVGEVNIPADKVLVNNPSALTDDEKAKVLEAVKKVNPDAKEITQDADGNVTVTTPDGHKEIITPEQVVKTAATANDPKAGNDIVKPADKVVVNDPAKLTDAEKEKIKAAVEAVNPNSIVVVDDKGNAKVSTPDGQTQVIPVEELVRTVEDTKKPNAGNDIVKPADKTVVANPEKLTDTEKKAIEDKVKAVNPDATVVVDDKGNTTVTTPEGKTAVIPAADLTKDPETATKPNAGNDIVKPADKTAVKDPANLTPEEKKAIEDKVKAVNPGATVVVDDKGNATVTTPEGKTAVIPATDLTKDPEAATKPNAGNDIVKPADKTAVKDPANLTPEEKKAIEDKVKAVNPGATVVVDDKGNTTVTTPEGKTAVIPAADLTKDPETATKPNAGNDIVKPADKTAVKDPANLTPEEKKAIEDKVKAVNPGATVVVDDKGNATVTTPEGKTAVIPAADLTKDPETATKPNAGNDIVKPADKTAVKDPANLTPEEKKAIEDKVKAVNPGATVVVDDKGNATVTTPEGKTAVIPATDLTKSPADAAKANAGNTVNTPAAKVEVKDPAKLTDEEKAKVKEAIEAVNPGSKVVVDDKGNATVTTPEGDVVVIPTTDLTKSPADAGKANAGNAVNTPAAKVEVKDPAKLTDEEKAKVKKAVEDVNPGSKVVVDDKGNTTVTTSEGKTATIPAADVTKSAADAGKANAGNAVNTPAAKVEVKDPANLTDAEKKAIEDKVKAVNPGSKVVVDDKGNVTVTTPEGKTATIPAADVTKSAADAGKANAGNGANTPATKTVVKDPAKLTDEEKAKVKKAVEDVNPGSTVVVNDKGDVIVTKGDGTVLVIPELDLVIPEDKLTDPTQQNGVNTPATRVLVGDKAKLTADEIEKVKESIKAVNPGSTVVVDDKGNATVTTPEGKTATIPAAQLVKDAKDVAAKNNGENINVDFEKETVADFNNLTDAEKEAAKAKIKGANADVVEVIFDKAGNATVITKDGKVYTIVAKDIFKQRPYVPSNGGGNNSGNGNGTSGNNGATNTDAKVDKAKLEGAIRQLDELIVKESAKLDAETAKEANALLADAKKVFANADASQAEVDAMVKRIEGFMAKVASSTDHATPANDQAAQTPAVDTATTQAASAQANARKVAKELPNTGTADSTVAMVAAAASALLGLGLAGRRRKEDEEA